MFLQVRMLLSDGFPTEARFMWSTAFNPNIVLIWKNVNIQDTLLLVQ